MNILENVVILKIYPFLAKIQFMGQACRRLKGMANERGTRPEPKILINININIVGV